MVSQHVTPSCGLGNQWIGCSLLLVLCSWSPSSNICKQDLERGNFQVKHPGRRWIWAKADQESHSFKKWPENWLAGISHCGHEFTCSKETCYQTWTVWNGERLSSVTRMDSWEKPCPQGDPSLSCYLVFIFDQSLFRFVCVAMNMAEGSYGVARLGYRYLMVSLSLTLGSCQVLCLDDALSSLRKSLLTSWQWAYLAVVPLAPGKLLILQPLWPEPIWQGYCKILGF